MVVQRSMLVAVLVVYAACHIPAQAESFGLAMGTPSNELDTIKDELAPPGMLRLLHVPKLQAGYKTYLGQFSEDQGLCWAKAIGDDIPSDPKGEQARAAFAEEKSRLSKIFGEPKAFDFRFTGRADSDLENWMGAISQGDRYFAAIWKQEYGADLSENLISVGLVLNASSSDIAYISLEYTFENIDLCEQEIQRQP